MAEAAAAVGYVLKNVAEGAVLLAKGIYDPTLPLRATLKPITSIPNVPRTQHAISVIKGRAYIFGGRGSDSADGQLADNDMHVVILPSSDLEKADYTTIPASAEAPPKRFGHSAAVIEDRIYIFGGTGQDGELLDEDGKVWVFDTFVNQWSFLGPPTAAGHRPTPRSGHSAIASDHPRKVSKPTYEGSLPQDPPPPGSALPEPPAPDSYGTVIVQGGVDKEGTQLTDLWSFDISSRSWSELPEPPPPVPSTANLALVGSRLFGFAGAQTHYLDLAPGSHDDRGVQSELSLAPKGPWLTFSSAEASDAQHVHPGLRSGAAMIPITTGQGRNYLLLAGGSSPSGDVLEDLWTLQLPPEGMTAASFKDAARQAIHKDTAEARWAEVRYYNEEGVMIQEGQDGRGIGHRSGFAASRDIEVDGASVVVWGGNDASGKARSDGVIISVE